MEGGQFWPLPFFLGGQAGCGHDCPPSNLVFITIAGPQTSYQQAWTPAPRKQLE
jgi:hypothetical protein